MRQIQNAVSKALATLTLSFIFFSSFALAGDAPWAQLNSYFGRSCESQGEWTQTALQQTQAVIISLQALRDDKDCGSVAGAISSLNSLQNRIESAQKATENQRLLASAEKLQQELLVKVASTPVTDPNYAIYQQRLIDTQLQILTIKSNVGNQAERTLELKGNLMSEIVASTNTAVDQVLANQKCTMNRPEIVTGIVGLAGTIASAATVANPILSMGLQTATQLIGKVVDAVREGILQAKIRKFQKVVEDHTVSCVLESISNDYCRTLDAKAAIDWKKSIKRREDTSELAQAVGLYDKEAPAFLDWISTLRTSRDPSDSYDSERQKRFFTREKQVKDSIADAIGIFNQGDQLLQSLDRPTDDQIWKIIKDTINDLAGRLGPGTNMNQGATPFSDIYAVEPYGNPIGFYFLIGIDKNNIPIAPPSAGVTYLSWPQFDAVRPPSDWKPPQDWKRPTDFTQIRIRFNEWSDLAKARLEIERSLVLNQDPNKLLKTCSNITGDNSNHKIKPCVALDHFIEHLDKRIRSGKVDPNALGLIKDTHALLRDVKKEMDNYSELSKDTLPSDSVATEYLRKITEKMKAESGDSFIRGRLDFIVSVTLLQLFSEGSPEDRQMATQSLAANRYMDVLKSWLGNKDDDILTANIKSASTIYSSNLKNFTNAFRRPIKKTLRRWRAAEEDSRGSVLESSYRDLRTRMCFFLQASPEWPQRLNDKFCSGLDIQYDSKNPKAPKTPVLNEAFWSKPFDEKACSYHRYRQNVLIFEGWDKDSGVVNR